MAYLRAYLYYAAETIRFIVNKKLMPWTFLQYSNFNYNFI